MLTTRKIHQLTWIYQRIYEDQNLKFTWEIEKIPESEDVDATIMELYSIKCLTTHRPHGGRPRYMFRWTVRNGTCASLRLKMSRDIRATLRYYARDASEEELEEFAHSLRATRRGHQSVHQEVVLKNRAKMMARRQKGGRQYPPVKKESPRVIPHIPRG
jgi:hypothetical protein